LGIIKGIFREIRDFFFGLLKQWLGYIFQATGAVTAILVAPYLHDANIAYAIYFIYAYLASVIVLRIAYRTSKWSLAYGRQFFRFMRWFITILAAIFAPLAPGFFPLLTIPEIIPRLAVALIVLILLLFLGGILGISDLFQDAEDRMVERYQKRLATPDYEAILMGEEFDYHPKPPPTRRERLRNWWEQEKGFLRRYIRKLRADP